MPSLILLSLQLKEKQGYMNRAETHIPLHDPDTPLPEQNGHVYDSCSPRALDPAILVLAAALGCLRSLSTLLPLLSPRLRASAVNPGFPDHARCRRSQQSSRARASGLQSMLMWHSRPRLCSHRYTCCTTASAVFRPMHVWHRRPRRCSDRLRGRFCLS